MQLKPGSRLESATCDAQVVVVKAPKDGADVDLRCGGEPMREAGAGGDKLPVSLEGDGTLLGKRYADEESGIELLASAAGAGTLSIGTTPIPEKGAKPLPSSD
jgi:hypothetical protein